MIYTYSVVGMYSGQKNCRNFYQICR